MVNYVGMDFGLKTEKLAARLAGEQNYFLAHIDNTTVFGHSHLVFVVPFTAGTPAHAVIARSVAKLINREFRNDETIRNLQWVPLPKAGDLKAGRDPDKPVLTQLVSTNIETGDADNCCTIPFYVQSRYLKTALQLTGGFSGYRDPRRISNPLCLFAKDDRGNEVQAYIMPHCGPGM